MSNTTYCNNDVAVPTPTPLPPCPNTESCDDFQDFHCVFYTGAPIPSIGVEPGDRGDEVIQKWGANQSTQAIEVQDSDTVDLEGSGLATAKLTASVKVDPVADNLIQRSAAGLAVQLNKPVLLAMFQTIAADPELKEAFCTLVGGCGEWVCNLVTGLQEAQIA